MDSNIKEVFLNLKVNGQRAAMSDNEKKQKDVLLIKYLNSVLDDQSVTDFFTKGFCYWNLSDNYSFLRDRENIYKNHREFYNHISSVVCPEYLFWPVSDASQKLTLELFGHSFFWWSIYREACVNNTSTPSLALFQSHRAALTTHPECPENKENLCFAKQQFELFLKAEHSTEKYIFYKTVYLSLISKHFSYDRDELVTLCEVLYNNLSADHPESNCYLLGEWEYLIEPISKPKMSTVGLCHAINAFIDNGETKLAGEIYNKARLMGLAKNYYIEKRL